MAKPIKKTAIAFALLALAYIAMSSMWFRFEHPCMTDTQLFLHTIDALMLRRLPGAC